MRRPELPPEYRVEGPFNGAQNMREKTWCTINNADNADESVFDPLVRIRTFVDGTNEAQTYARSKFGEQTIPFPDAESMVKWLETVALLGEL